MVGPQGLMGIVVQSLHHALSFSMAIGPGPCWEVTPREDKTAGVGASSE